MPAAPAAPAHNEVLDQVRRQFHEVGHPALRHVSCRWDDGVLTLRGRLGSFYEKQLAQSRAARVGGVRQVVNEIEVVTSL